MRPVFSFFRSPGTKTFALLSIAAGAVSLMGACGNGGGGGGGNAAVSSSADGELTGVFGVGSSSSGAGGSGAGSASGSGGSGGGAATCNDLDPAGGATSFAKGFGPDGTQSILAVSTDKQGNILLAGAFDGSINLGGQTLTSAGKQDIFIAKLSPTGQHIWSKRFGDSYNQTATGIGADANGNVIVTGIFIGNVDFGGGTLTSDTIFFQDVFLAKFTPDGTHIFSKRYGDSNIQYANGLAVDLYGNAIISGYFQNNVDFGGGTLTSAGDFDVFVAKFDGSGAHVWSKRFGDAQVQRGRAVAVDGSGNVVIGGDAQGMTDFGGGALTAGTTSSAFVAKLSADGKHVWSKMFGAGKALGQAVAVAPNGDVALAGAFEGTIDFGGGPMENPNVQDAFVAVLGGASGAHVWSKQLGDDLSQSATGVAFTAKNEALLAGGFTGTIPLGASKLSSQGGFDAFVMRFDGKGCPVWARSYGDPAVQSPQSLMVDPISSGAFLAGSFGGTVDFGSGPIAATADDAFLVKLVP
jgi:hypothetical protein